MRGCPEAFEPLRACHSRSVALAFLDRMRHVYSYGTPLSFSSSIFTDTLQDIRNLRQLPRFILSYCRLCVTQKQRRHINIDPCHLEYLLHATLDTLDTLDAFWDDFAFGDLGCGITVILHRQVRKSLLNLFGPLAYQIDCRFQVRELTRNLHIKLSLILANVRTSVNGNMAAFFERVDRFKLSTRLILR